MRRSCPLVPANWISKSAGQLKITNLYSKLRGKICFKYSRFEKKDSNIRILFGLQNSRIRIRIFEIRGKRFESESNPNIFDHLWLFNESDPGPPIVLLSDPRLVGAAAISLPSFLGECPVIEPVTRATLQMAPRTDVVCYKPRCLQFPNINVFWLSLFAVSWLWAEEEANTDNSSSDIRQHVLKAIHKYLHINGTYHLMMCEVYSVHICCLQRSISYI